MRAGLFQRLLLIAASLLAPGERRGDWLAEWHSELWYMPPDRRLRACLGSFRDAFWLRRNTPVAAWPHVISPMHCLGLLSVAGVLGSAGAWWLLKPLGAETTLWKLSARDLLPCCAITFAATLVLLLVAWGGAEGRFIQPAPGRTGRILFLLAKLIAIQPLVVCALFSNILLAARLPLAPLLALGFWYLLVRWTMDDQQRRCPQCLSRLEMAVSMGTSASAFLAWHGIESVCSQGHGILHSPATRLSHCGPDEWLPLDSTWSDLFTPGPRGARP